VLTNIHEKREEQMELVWAVKNFIDMNEKILHSKMLASKLGLTKTCTLGEKSLHQHTMDLWWFHAH
jgi:hypothetical protein